MSKTNLSIVGLGTLPEKHITLEATESILQSKKIFLLGISEEEVKKSVPTLNQSEIYDLMHFYQDGGKDVQHYYNIAKYVLGNLSKNNLNLLILAGDPRVGVALTSILEKVSKTYNIEVNTIAGISSSSTILHDLHIDILNPGTVYLDVNRCISRNLTINNQLYNILYHVCSIGLSETYINNPSKYNRSDLLMNYLIKFYPSNHHCILIRSRETLLSTSEIKEFELRDLNENLKDVSFSSTLVMKPLIES